MVYFLKLNMGVYLRAKFDVSSIILTSFRQGGGGNFTLHPPTSKGTPKKPTQIRVNVQRPYGQRLKLRKLSEPRESLKYVISLASDLLENIPLSKPLRTFSFFSLTKVVFSKINNFVSLSRVFGFVEFKFINLVLKLYLFFKSIF